MNQAKRAREIEQFFITITRASAALEATLKREFGLSLGEYRVLDEVASAGKIGIRMGELAQSVIFSPTNSIVAVAQSPSPMQARNLSPPPNRLSEHFCATLSVTTSPMKTSTY